MLTRAPGSSRISMQLDFSCDALSVFNQNKRGYGDTPKQHKLPNKRAVKSEWEKCSKQMPNYVA